MRPVIRVDEGGELPPVVPVDLPALERLIVLLGARTKGNLGPAKMAEIRVLCGVFPTVTQATRWKTELKDVYEQMKSEPDPESDTP